MKHKKAVVLAAGVLMAAGAASPAMADADAAGSTIGSPGVLSGNSVRVPVHVPVNVCRNTVDIIALPNPTFGNACVNG